MTSSDSINDNAGTSAKVMIRCEYPFFEKLVVKMIEGTKPLTPALASNAQLLYPLSVLNDFDQLLQHGDSPPFSHESSPTVP